MRQGSVRALLRIRFYFADIGTIENRTIDAAPQGGPQQIAADTWTRYACGLLAECGDDSSVLSGHVLGVSDR
jgi:hypothetical protein